jgi:glutaredoxin
MARFCARSAKVLQCNSLHHRDNVMKKITILTIALAMLALPASAAQLYRWVDEKGRVEWRDTPPPPNAKKVEQRKISTGTIQPDELPYSLQQSVKNFPVTLWVTNCGDVCDKARAHLTRRGVPHTERNPQSEIEEFKKFTGGSLEVPQLMVGSNRLKGYLESSWDAALDFAGYPKTALIAVKPVIKPAPAAAKPAPAPTPDGADATPPPAAPAQ